MANHSPGRDSAAAETHDGDVRLWAAIEEAGLATWDVDLAAGEAVWSANHFRLFGYPVDPTGRATVEMWSSCLHPEDRQRVYEELERAGRERAFYRLEHRILRADTGEVVWIEPRGRFFYDSDGRARRQVGVCFDITTRKQAEERLVRREAQLDLATRLVGIGVFDHDHVENRLYWSDQFRQIHDMPRDVEPQFELLEAQTHPEDRATLAAAIAAAHDPQGEGRFSVEYRIRRANGDVRRIVGRAQTLFVGEGAQRRPVRTVGAELDVTDRRLVEARLREADQRKDEFLAMLAHELRNPLAPIRTAAEMLTWPNLPDAQLSWSRQVIHRQVEHMARLLDDLLDVARITRGKLELKIEPVDLGTIVDTAVEAARPLITARKHGLTVDLPPQLPTLDADPVRLAQVVSNLLTNAAKYTDPSGHIVLTARVAGGVLRISVKDNGIGLAAPVIANIFEMFSQGQEARGRAEGGLGIGLALVKGLVDLHGGTIDAFSEGPGRGSEFVVTLPCRRGVAPAEPPAVAQPGGATVARKILIADDNVDAANSLAMLLRLAGHDVCTAHGGQAALQLASTFHPDIALLDIGMPDLSGYDVAKQLRGSAEGQALRLIAVTGWGQEDDKRRAREAGFDHHLTKPVDPRRLDALLASGAREP